jgi:hypothetical protein
MKRDRDSLGDLESPPAKKKQTWYYYDRPDKRKIEETGLHSVPEPLPKRVARHRPVTLTHDDDDGVGYEAQSLPGPETRDSVYSVRVKNYKLFESSVNEENLWDYMAQIYEESDRTTLAEVMHDCPQNLRLATLARLDAKSKSVLLSQISDIERQKQKNDPKSIFPTIMTDMLAREHSSSPICMICHDGFCSANRENPVDIENVVKKTCGSHIMHWACFRRKVIDGEMPLHGPCACFEDISNKMEF